MILQYFNLFLNLPGEDVSELIFYFLKKKKLILNPSF